MFLCQVQGYVNPPAPYKDCRCLPLTSGCSLRGRTSWLRGGGGERDKGNFILAGITTEQVLQAVDVAVEMNKDGALGIPVPNYVDENVSVKVVKLIQSYTGVVNKMVWRKY